MVGNQGLGSIAKRVSAKATQNSKVDPMGPFFFHGNPSPCFLETFAKTKAFVFLAPPFLSKSRHAAHVDPVV